MNWKMSSVFSNVRVAGILLGGILVNIPLAVAWYYGNLSTYMDSYFIASIGEKNHSTGTLWMTSTWSSMLPIGFTFSGIISHRIGARLTLLAGMICFNLGIYTSFFTLQSSFWSLHITLGVLTGIGTGFCYSMTLLYTVTWVKQRVGLCSAIVSSALGGGSLLYNLAITLFINPQNLEADVNVGESKYFSQDDIINRVPYVFLVIGAMTTGFHVVAFPLMRNHPDFTEKTHVLTSSSKTSLSEYASLDESDNLPKNGIHIRTIKSELYGATESVDSSAENLDHQLENHENDNTDGRQHNESIISKDLTAVVGITLVQALQTKTFYLLGISLALLMVGYVVENNSYKQFGVLYISDDYFLANIGVGISVAVCISRILWGLMLDIFSAKSVLLSMASTHVILSVFWYFTPFVDKWFYLIWTMSLQAFQSGCLIIYPICVLKFFGRHKYITIYGMMCCFSICVYYATPPIAQVILTELGWFWLFSFVSVTSFASLILNICLPQNCSIHA